ncbi:hypothetical protein BJ508DRAFT_379279 [Ascobolus immersus RN42]|uniref:Uncharacterized protein n=1 Tax=Ascobolus immersus RN42 TaxID=1160509 RepID=A0A3N4HSI6_ASCIM|nr:hypothetical protein BJ508DRAFT_379279 [Ascobolus immersus RN42]
MASEASSATATPQLEGPNLASKSDQFAENLNSTVEHETPDEFVKYFPAYLKALPTLQIEKSVAERFEVLYHKITSPDYMEIVGESPASSESQSVLDERRAMYRMFCRDVSSHDLPAHLLINIDDNDIALETDALNSALKVQITHFRLANLVIWEMIKIMEKHPVLGLEVKMLRPALRSVALAFGRFFSTLSPDLRRPKVNLNTRLERGLARKEQLDLIKLVLDSSLKDYNFMVREVNKHMINSEIIPSMNVFSTGAGRYRSFWTRNIRLLRFLIEMRSESIESRIWKHLMDEENGKVVIVLNEKSFHYLD